MRSLFLLSVLTLFPALAVPAQFDVNIGVDSTDPELEKTFGEALRIEFGKIKDVTQSGKGKYRLIVELIKRPVGTNAFDVFISTVSTSAAACIIGQDEKGRVYSRRRCEEYLKSGSYVGRASELDEIAKEIVEGFDGFVLEPLRGIEN